MVETKLRDAEIASRMGKWLSEPVHAARVADETATVLRVAVELLNDEDIQHAIDKTIVKRLAEPQWGPPVGRVLGQLLAENRREALIQLLCDRAFEWALNAGPTIPSGWSCVTRQAGRRSSSTSWWAIASTAS